MPSDYEAFVDDYLKTRDRLDELCKVVEKLNKTVGTLSDSVIEVLTYLKSIDENIGGDIGVKETSNKRGKDEKRL